MSGLFPKKLYYTLTKDTLKTMEELMNKAAKIMNAEETMATKRSSRVKAEGKNDKKDHRDPKEHKESK